MRVGKRTEGTDVGARKRAGDNSGPAPAMDAEGLLGAYAAQTGNAISRSQLNRYLKEGILPPPDDAGLYRQNHLERLRMIGYLRARYGMSLKDISGLFGVIGGMDTEEALGEPVEEKQELDRRQKIVDNASELFAAKGYHGTTIDEIVQATGIAKGTFYIYFDSKETLLVEVIKRLVSTTMERIDARLAEKKERDFIANIEMKGQEFLDLYLSKSQLLYMLIGEAVGNQRLMDQLEEVFRQMAASIERDLREGIQAGELYPYSDLRTVAYALVGMGQTIAILLSAAGEEQVEKTRKTVHELMRRAFSAGEDRRDAVQGKSRGKR